jgi:hypothetical protein
MTVSTTGVSEVPGERGVVTVDVQSRLTVVGTVQDQPEGVGTETGKLSPAGSVTARPGSLKASPPDALTVAYRSSVYELPAAAAAGVPAVASPSPVTRELVVDEVETARAPSIESVRVAWAVCKPDAAGATPAAMALRLVPGAMAVDTDLQVSRPLVGPLTWHCQSGELGAEVKWSLPPRATTSVSPWVVVPPLSRTEAFKESVKLDGALETLDAVRARLGAGPAPTVA